MIDYVEIRAKLDRSVIGIVDTAKSIIWKSIYFGVGEFEIYATANQMNIALLVEGNYVTRQDNFECGIIEHIEITENAQDGKMIVASGRFLKSILDRRIVFTAVLNGTGSDYIWNCSPTMLNGNVEGAVRKVIYDNAVNCINEYRPEAGEYRNMPEIHWTDDDVTGLDEEIVVDATASETESAEKQVTYKNLLEYTDGVLQEYQLGAKMWLDRSLLKFRYKVFKGEDRSRDSSTHEPIIFSTEFDNLTSSTYILDTASSKNTALIGGEGEGTDRKCAFAYGWNKGLDRRETFIDASSITQEAQSNIDYRKQLEAQGQQSIAELQKTESFDGTIDLTNTNLKYGVDYNLGDLITIEDKQMGVYINARILTITEVQDDNGYQIDIEYGI